MVASVEEEADAVVVPVLSRETFGVHVAAVGGVVVLGRVFDHAGVGGGGIGHGAESESIEGFVGDWHGCDGENGDGGGGYGCGTEEFHFRSGGGGW